MRISRHVVACLTLIGLAACAANRTPPEPYALDASAPRFAIEQAPRGRGPSFDLAPSDLRADASIGGERTVQAGVDAPGASPWRARAVGGAGFAGGTDAPESGGLFGLDFGRQLANGMEVGLVWREMEASFDRQPGGTDCGTLRFAGVKASVERMREASAFYAWGGLGAGAFWADDYLDEDSGFGLLGEGGVGYVLSDKVRLRLGVGVHGLDTDVGRDAAADDGSSRWLWIVAPALQLEFRF